MAIAAILETSSTIERRMDELRRRDVYRVTGWTDREQVLTAPGIPTTRNWVPGPNNYFPVGSTASFQGPAEATVAVELLKYDLDWPITMESGSQIDQTISNAFLRQSFFLSVGELRSRFVHRPPLREILVPAKDRKSQTGEVPVYIPRTVWRIRRKRYGSEIRHAMVSTGLAIGTPYILASHGPDMYPWLITAIHRMPTQIPYIYELTVEMTFDPDEWQVRAIWKDESGRAIPGATEGNGYLTLRTAPVCSNAEMLMEYILGKLGPIRPDA